MLILTGKLWDRSLRVCVCKHVCVCVCVRVWQEREMHDMMMGQWGGDGSDGNNVPNKALKDMIYIDLQAILQDEPDTKNP